MSDLPSSFPNREDVARPFSEAEAFRHARKLYQELITSRTPDAAASIISKSEARVFQPACELQFAGLTMLSGRDFPKQQAVIVCGWLDCRYYGSTTACLDLSTFCD